jgi:hypothetical protein
MNTSQHTAIWLLDSELAPHVDAFMLHLFDCRYASNTINNYLAGLTHFAHWITQCNIKVKNITDQVIQQFLDDHLPDCHCEAPVFRDRNDLHAALGSSSCFASYQRNHRRSSHRIILPAVTIAENELGIMPKFKHKI